LSILPPATEDEILKLILDRPNKQCILDALPTSGGSTGRGRGGDPPLDWGQKKFIARPKNTHLQTPFCMPECAKTHLQQSRISKFSGGGPPDPLFKGRGGKGKGGEEREGKGKGRMEEKDREWSRDVGLETWSWSRDRSRPLFEVLVFVLVSTCWSWSWSWSRRVVLSKT